jgi:hypothetical protein
MVSMERLGVGTVIAERQLQFRDPKHGERTVRVLLGAPMESPGSGEWYCPWQILGLGGDEVRATYGIDAFQCLQLVMKMIGANLYAQTDHGKQVSWINGQSADFGFPCE